MCGRFGIDADTNDFKVLKVNLGIDAAIASKRNITPFSTAEIVLERKDDRRVENAVWSVLIEPKPDDKGYRPLKSKKDGKPFKSFNAKSTRLTSSPAWKPLYKSHRCIVPASYFHEWAEKVCYKIAPVGQAIAFGGLYRVQQFNENPVHTFTIITLPGHPKLQHIHKQSVPLMLQPDDYDAWLDPHFSHTDAFNDLLKPQLRSTLEATPVDSPNTLKAIGDTEVVTAD